MWPSHPDSGAELSFQGSVRWVGAFGIWQWGPVIQNSNIWAQSRVTEIMFSGRSGHVLVTSYGCGYKPGVVGVLSPACITIISCAAAMVMVNDVSVGENSSLHSASTTDCLSLVLNKMADKFGSFCCIWSLEGTSGATSAETFQADSLASNISKMW